MACRLFPLELGLEIREYPSLQWALLQLLETFLVTQICCHLGCPPSPREFVIEI